ncbi:hypothetical protein OS122_23775 [Mycolicibacterium mucogenicum]|uniref:hypothetical protein n=1 Tax=Mycolicibacterium mucogenicum TaxID=56689 RepID=UPI002269B8F8|nr:hypothetical protein [Mycolicibacterium mucogenicum]MCX8563921.1 hypothetical protein [Mycolicibacterium mucogenicum]
MTESTTTARDLLRADILAGGRDDYVSMADIRGRINRRKLVTTDAERQQLMLTTIRSLLEDGLVEVGDIPGPDDPGFLVWPGQIDDVMAELTERIVEQWEDPGSWEYSTWLNLTEAGRSSS